MGKRDKNDFGKLDLGILEISRYGIFSLTDNGRILFLFLTEVLGFWFASFIIRNWESFSVNEHGITILVFSISVLGCLFISIFFKERIGFETSEYLKQFGILLFIILVYLVLYYYSKEQFDSTYYLNPMKLLYTFILVEKLLIINNMNAHHRYMQLRDDRMRIIVDYTTSVFNNS